jgi:hypothetical protein
MRVGQGSTTTCILELSYLDLRKPYAGRTFEEPAVVLPFHGALRSEPHRMGASGSGVYRSLSLNMFRCIACNAVVAAVLLTSGCMPSLTTVPALRLQADATQLTTEEREAIIDAITHHVREYFAHWAGVPGLNYDSLVAEYHNAALASPDRRAFGLATLEFFAALENGHTSFSDRWLSAELGQPI